MKQIGSWLKSYGWIIPVLLLMVYLLYQYPSNKIQDLQRKLNVANSELVDKQKQWNAELNQAKQLAEDIKLQYRVDLQTAILGYESSLLRLKPDAIVTERIVKDYAKTANGQRVCLDAGGVQRFYEARERLLNSHPASAP